MSDNNERLTKEAFADKCISYKALMREIDLQEKKSYLKRELTIYLVFMIVFVVWVTSFAGVTDSYHFEQVVHTTLVDRKFPETTAVNNLNYVTFYDIQTKETYFQWLKNVVQPDLFAPASTANNKTGEILDWNELLWGLRFRQLRVDVNKGCSLPAKIVESGIIPDRCTSPYSTLTRSVDSFGPATLTNATSASGAVVQTKTFAYTWRDVDFTGASSFEGELATYDGTGFVVDVALNSTVSKFATTLSELEQHFVDDQTRAVFLSFSLYNANFNLFMFCNFVAEFGPSGTIVPVHSCRAAPLLPGPNSDPGGLATLCNILLVLFIFFYTYKLVVKELRFIRRLHLWTVLDVVSLVLLFFHLAHVVRFQLFGEGQALLADALKLPDFYSLDSVTSWYRDLRAYYATNMILICIRIFKYLQLSAGLAMVWKTMQHAVRDMVFFLGLFVIMFVGFMLCAYIVFGPHLQDYTTIGYSSSTLLRMVIGEIDYAPLRRINPQFAWLFFAVYVILFFFILVNIFMAIILDAWQAEAEAERKAVGTKVDIMDEIRAEFARFYVRFRRDGFKRSWRRFATSVLNRIRRRRSATADFLPEEVVLAKLQAWKRKRQNAAKAFVTISDLQQALEGVPKETDVKEEQLVAIFESAEKYLVPLESAAAANAEDEAEDLDDTRDMNLSELKKLQAGFLVLSDTQQRLLTDVMGRLQALQQLQQTTSTKVDFLDTQVQKIVPHFAD